MKFTSKIIKTDRNPSTNPAPCPVSYREAQEKIYIAPPAGVTKVSPIIIVNNERGGKTIRARLVGDELASNALPKGQRPSRRAIKMASALKLESLLESGEFENITQLSEATGVRRDTLVELLKLLNRDVREIEKILFELS